jgi:lactoylglutathione lyase
MHIEHIAIWVSDLEKTRNFYEKYFAARSNDGYYNPSKNFRSYFLRFDNGCRLELMQKPEVNEESRLHEKQKLGIVHFAVSVGSREKVDVLTEQLRKGGYTIVSEPRTTGDGYYESVVLDCENNLIEITV